jgi:hypothetical protein
MPSSGLTSTSTSSDKEECPIWRTRRRQHYLAATTFVSIAYFRMSPAISFLQGQRLGAHYVADRIKAQNRNAVMSTWPPSLQPARWHFLGNIEQLHIRSGDKPAPIAVGRGYEKENCACCGGKLEIERGKLPGYSLDVTGHIFPLRSKVLVGFHPCWALLGFLQHRRIIRGQNRLKQLRDRPLHWELPLLTSQARMKTGSLSATLTTWSGPGGSGSKCF